MYDSQTDCLFTRMDITITDFMICYMCVYYFWGLVVTRIYEWIILPIYQSVGHGHGQQY